MGVTEQDIRAALDGHFWTLRVDPVSGVAQVCDQRVVPRMPRHEDGLSPGHRAQMAEAAARRAAIRTEVLALKAAGHTQAAIAHMLGTSCFVVHRILRGE